MLKQYNKICFQRNDKQTGMKNMQSNQNSKYCVSKNTKYTASNGINANA